MALVIYDQGYRIQTPVKSIFRPGGVEQITELAHAAETAGQHDRERERDKIPTGQKSPSGAAGGRAGQIANIYRQADQANPKQAAPRSYIPASLIMSQPVHTVMQGSLIKSALYKMKQMDISHLLVLSGAGRIMGIVTEKLLLQHLSTPSAKRPSIEDSIEGCYSTQVITATPDTNIRQLAVTCVEHQLSCIPIVKDTGSLIGIVTRTDLLQSLINNEWLDSRSL